MEVAVVSALITTIIARLFAVLEKKYGQLCDLHDAFNFMMVELQMIGAEIEDQLSQRGHMSTVQRKYMDMLQELALDIEDCLDQFLVCTACEESIRDPVRFADEILKLEKRLEAANQLKPNYNVKVMQQASAVAGPEDPDTPEDFHYVSIEKPIQEILDLLECKRDKIMVVSIVGFGGSGRTELAKAVYSCPEAKVKYKRCAWAVASSHKDDIEGLLTTILKQLLPGEAPVATELRRRMRYLLQDKSARFLIVIDDIKTELWNALKLIFPEETESRILVTTTVTSVANACSFPGGYVYNMRSLTAKESKDYLDKNVFIGGCSPDMERGSRAIVKNCDGHPLALVSVGQALQGHRLLTGDLCEELTQNLCSRMDENKNGDFTKLRQVLMNNYTSLPGNDLKTCLLYTSLFPNGRPVSRRTITSRWLAEGYIDGDQEIADKTLDELIDRNIIRPIDPSYNGKAKTCKPHGIVHQFTAHRSMSSGFIATSFGANNRSNYRHLVTQNARNVKRPSLAASSKGLAASSKGLAASSKGVQLRPRSLTVFGSAEEAVYKDLTNSKLLRVLDLKECHDFNEDNLKSIYKLLHLKYLTLGSSVTKLSHKMENLHCLETLDLRKTKIETLPVEVISLPHLAHLFGKIKINKLSGKKLQKFIPGKSNLQTLAGVVVDNDSGFLKLMVHMKKLTRVKIWCEITSRDSNYSLLSEAIHKFAQAGLDTPAGHRSLSLHLNGYSEDLLHYHQYSKTNTESRKLGYLTSLKLQGRPSEFRQFLMSLVGLEELCLTYGNLTGPILSELDTLQRLVYLKLVQVHLGDLDINVGDFPSLRRLCLVVKEPRFPTIAQGALPSLTSIQLLCEDLEDLCGIKIEWLTNLQEIALDSMVNKETVKLWENEAKKHTKRPMVMLLKRVVNPAESRSLVKYVASSEIDNNSYTDTFAANHVAIDLESLTLQQHTRSDQVRFGHKAPHSPERGLIKSKLAMQQKTSGALEVDPAVGLAFPFTVETDISCCMQLTNNTGDFIAFNIIVNTIKYCARPDNGTMPPFSKLYITLTLQAQQKAPPHMQCHDMLLLQSTRVQWESGETTDELFENAAARTAVHEVKLPIVYVP